MKVKIILPQVLYALIKIRKERVQKKKKGKQGKALLEEYIEQCEKSYVRWQDVFDNGCFDPTWADGVNLNLVRNHILIAKKNISKLCEQEGFESPPILLREVPPKVDTDYMAKAEWLREQGTIYLTKMEGDSRFQELQQEIKRLSPKQKLRSEIQRVVCESTRLKRAVENDKLVDIRGLLRWQGEFFDNVEKALAVARELPTETFQLTLFDIA